MTIAENPQPIAEKAAVLNLIAETRALLEKLDAVAAANGAAWHVDAALNELYTVIEEDRPDSDLDSLIAQLSPPLTTSRH